MSILEELFPKPDLSNPLLPESCAGCAACCFLYDIPVFSSEDVPEEMTEDAPEDMKIMARKIMKKREDKSCVALDLETGLCTIYDARPKVCQRFQMGGKGCLSCLKVRKPLING